MAHFRKICVQDSQSYNFSVEYQNINGMQMVIGGYILNIFKEY